MAHVIMNYNFKVTIGVISLGFAKVSGISRSVDVMTYTEGGLNDIVHVFPERMKQAGTLHMEAGVVLEAVSPLYHVGTSIDVMRVEVLNASRFVMRIYTFKNLVISKWELSDLDAQSAAILIDRFDVSYGEAYVGI